MTDEITERISELKEIFIGVAVLYGSPPDISQLSFLDFCLQSGITDVYLTPSVLDVYFKATNYEQVS